MKNFYEKYVDILNPIILKQNLTIASLYIAVFDNFKNKIISMVKDFYICGFTGDNYIYRGYNEQVLDKVNTKKNRQILATLLWLKEHNMIDDADISKFHKYTDMRNNLAHEMIKMLTDGFPDNIYDLYFEMISLFEKIERKWILEIEIPINPPNIPMSEIKLEEVTSVNLEFIKIMTDIAFTNNDKYMKTVKKYNNSL